MVESALSVVVLCACFSLIFWNGLILRKLSRVRRSYYTAWLYFPEMPYVSCALQVAWLATSGYLLWTGTERYQPAELLDSFNGQMYTAAFCLFFLFIGVETLLNQHLERLDANNEIKFFVFVDFALWVIFWVIGYIDGTIWASTWPASRVLGFVLIFTYPLAVPWPPLVAVSLYANSQGSSDRSSESLYAAASVSERRVDLRKREGTLSY